MMTMMISVVNKVLCQFHLNRITHIAIRDSSKRKTELVMTEPRK